MGTSTYGETAQAETHAGRWQLSLSAIVFNGGAGICAGLLLLHYLTLIPSKADVSLNEGVVAFASLRLAHGGPLYIRPDSPPYTATVYGPLLYICLAALYKLTHPSSFWAYLIESRVLTFTSFLLIALLAYRWARRLCPGSGVAVAVPLLLLASGFFYPYAATPRPDVPALLFSLLGFLVISEASESSSARSGGAGLLMGFALLFKQSFLAAPAAAALCLLGERRYRSLGLLLAGALLPAAATFGWLSIRGEPVIYSLLLPRHTLYNVPSEVALALTAALESPESTLGVFLGVVGVFSLWQTSRRRARWLSTYLVFAAVEAAITMAQVGADHYYLIETVTLCTVLAPAGFSSWMLRVKKKGAVPLAGTLALLLTLPTFNVLVWRRGTAPPDEAPLEKAIAGRRVLSDFGSLAAQGKDPELIDPWANALWERVGYWSSHPLVEQIREQQFDYVIAFGSIGGQSSNSFPRTYRGVAVFGPPILKQLAASYRLAGTCLEGEAVIFVPDGEPRGAALAHRLSSACGWGAAQPKPARNP